MEKAAGVQVNEVWSRMSIKERFEVVKAISKYQEAWMSTSFTQYGSLYYATDLGSAGNPCPEHSRFAVGPSTGREFLDDGRIAVDFDRGPWHTVAQYKSAVGNRELTYVQNMTRLPRSVLSLFGPGTYQPSQSKKIRALQNYLRLVKYLLPTDQSLTSAYLWHPDLHSENIFVHPGRPAEVLSIIDWQSAEVLPLFDHARQPYFLDYDGPQSTGLRPPAFPADFDTMDPAQKAEAHSRYIKMSFSAYYRAFARSRNKTLSNAMEFRETPSFDMLLLAQNLLVDGEAFYQARCLDLEEDWASLPGVQASGSPPFPLRFSEEEVAQIDDDVAGAARSMELMRDLIDSLGSMWPEKGIVRPDQYDEVKMRLKQAKTDIIDWLAHSEAERIAWEEAWPFDS